jgi:hypothetical protein
MKKPRSALVILVLLVLGLSCAVPAEDLAETAYDESEALPYEGTALISDVVSQTAASTSQAVQSTHRLLLAYPFRVAAMRINRTEAHHSDEATVALALLCTLLC